MVPPMQQMWEDLSAMAMALEWQKNAVHVVLLVHGLCTAASSLDGVLRHLLPIVQFQHLQVPRDRTLGSFTHLSRQDIADMGSLPV